MNLPSVEVLESRHQFPCSFTFKAIGSADGKFAARVVSALRQELELEEDPPHRFRTAKNGRHVSVTLEPYCESAQQVLAVYTRLMEVDGLVMLL